MYVHLSISSLTMWRICIFDQFFYISLPFVDFSQLFLLQRFSIQHLRLFTWYRAAITWQLKVSLQAMMSTSTKMKSLMQQHTRMTWTARLFTCWKHVLVLKRYWDFITDEGSESFSCSELLQVECICVKLSRMCVSHITATRNFDFQSFLLHGDSNRFLWLYILSRNLDQTYPRKFELCVCMQLWEIIYVPCMKSSISTSQCCNLCYSIMSHAALILLHHASIWTMHNSIISH